MITAKRIADTLTWMIEDCKHRADETKLNTEEYMKGGYSKDLTEAIDLLNELNQLTKFLIVDLNNIPSFKEGRLTRDDVSSIIMDALKIR